MAIRHVGASSTRGLLNNLRRPAAKSPNRLPPMPSAVVRVPGESDSATADMLPAVEFEALQTPAADPARTQAAPADPATAATMARLTSDVSNVRVGATPASDRVPPVDYHSILAAAVTDVANSTPAARRAVYDHARETVHQRLKRIQPPLSSFAIAREQLTLDRAITRIEEESLERDALLGLPPPPKEPPPAPEEPAEPEAASPVPPIATKPRHAPVQVMHGIILRTFGMVAAIGVVVVGFWFATGKSNNGERSMTRSFSQLLTRATSPPPREQQQAAAPASEQPAAPEQPVAAAVTQRADAAPQEIAPALPVQITPELAADPWSASGGPPAVDPKSPHWVATLPSIAETSIPTAPTTAAPRRLSTHNAHARERYERGLVRARADEVEKSLADFSEAIRADPQFTEAYLQRGQARFKNGDVDGAVADFTHVAKLDPRNAPAFKMRGMAMLYQGNDDAAIADLTKAIQYAEAEPGRLPALETFYARRSRAALYDRKQLFDNELVDLNAMLEGYWKWPELSSALRASYRENGAANLIASIYRMRASVQLKRANVDAAIADMSFAIQLDQQRALQFTLERARIQEGAGRASAALADYQRVLELNSGNVEAQIALSRLRPPAR